MIFFLKANAQICLLLFLAKGPETQCTSYEVILIKLNCKTGAEHQQFHEDPGPVGEAIFPIYVEEHAGLPHSSFFSLE